jgi:beta-lactam-binding protein with PASTA domain
LTEGATTTRAPRRRAARSARLDWIFALALATFVGVCVWFGRSVYDFLTPPSQTISTPTFVGQTESDALSEATRTRVRAVVVARTASDRYPKGVVSSQEPKPGAQVREGRQISLIVSQGLQIIAMPDLRYETMREVGLDLSHARLTLGKVKYLPSTEVPAGRVIEQDPGPLASAREGTVVNVTVSKGGGASAGTRIPSFVNMSIDEARDAATAAGVRLGQVVWTPFGRNGPPHGSVVRQEPAPGTRAGQDQTVSLQVSAGPDQAGYIVRQVHTSVTVPDGDGAQLVRIAVHDETGSWNVYDAYAQPKQKLDFVLTVVGTSELDTYVNNELLGSTQLGVEPKVQPPAPRPGKKGP